MGLIGITEGAIPFAAADPIRVIPSIMCGSAIGSAIALLFGAGNPAPWGGWIVLPVASGKLGYMIGTIVGVLITAVLVNILKKPVADKLSNVSTGDNGSDEIELDFE
jgi:fructose-specific PTS system IIC-like component